MGNLPGNRGSSPGAPETPGLAPGSFIKLSLASMLHDVTLPRDDLAEIEETEELSRAGLSDADLAIVRRHPLEAAQLLGGFDEVPGEVAFIVEQHHERADGGGFPKGVGHKDISSIAALFIIAHDMVNVMYGASAAAFDMDAFLKQREKEKRYTKGAFGQVFRAIASKIGSL